MEKRAFGRIPGNIKVRYHLNHTDYSGTITNLSEKGMFIRSHKISYPLEQEFEITFSIKEEILCVPVNLVRIIMSLDFHNGMGVELIDPPKKYLEFLDNLKRGKC